MDKNYGTLFFYQLQKWNIQSEITNMLEMKVLFYKISKEYFSRLKIYLTVKTIIA